MKKYLEKVTTTAKNAWKEFINEPMQWTIFGIVIGAAFKILFFM